ncbi:MAG: glycosyltransferase [Planctomycetota bacterium]
MPKISLCAIVKDEERFLPACLASVRDVADELVVVDTGSTDRTRDLAREAGAIVVEHAWTGDFAAARNAGLDRASGTHVLVLDADERLARGAGDALRRAAARADLVIGMLPLHDADALDARDEDVLSGARRLTPPAWLARFFRASKERRFRRRVHETILPPPGVELAEGAIAAVDAPIVHVGEVPALRAERNKRARNTELLERAVREDPADGELAGYLAMELARGGELARAESVANSAFEPFLARIDALPPRSLKPSPVQLAHVLATCRLARGDARGALTALDAAAKRCIEPHPNLCFLAGTAHERLDETDAAERAYRECLALDGRRFTLPVAPDFTAAAPRARLASLALARGRAREALELLAPVERPSSAGLATAARLLRAEARLVLRDSPAALRELAPLLASGNANALPPDLFALAAWAAAASGADEPSFADAARRAAPERWIEPRRRNLLRTS